MSNRMLASVGFSRPFRFERAIIAGLALVLALAVLLAAGWLVAIEELTAFGPRAFYFLYLLALLGLSIVLVRWPRIAGGLLILALIDFGWGVGSYALRHSALGGASLLPPAGRSRCVSSGTRCCRPCPSPRCASPRHRPCDQPRLPKAHAVATPRRGNWRRATSWRPSAARRPTISAPAKATPGATGSPPPSSKATAKGASSSSITACRATPRSNT